VYKSLFRQVGKTSVDELSSWRNGVGPKEKMKEKTKESRYSFFGGEAIAINDS